MDPLTVLIPAYNEEESIADVVRQAQAVLKKRRIRHEIIIIDDGSSDGTFEKTRRISGVRVLRHSRNRGYGAALKTGINHARHELICITDADGTYPHEKIPALLKRFDSDCDMAVGARTGGKVAIPLARRPAKWFIGKLANIVAGQTIPDINSGLRIFRKSVAEKFIAMMPDGFSFTTTITLAMIANGYLVDYIPIDYHNRLGKSKIRPVHDTLNFIQLIVRITLYFAPLKIFLSLGMMLFLLGIAWGFFSYFVLGRFADASTIVILMASLQTAMVGLLAELINRRLPNHYR
ncbi:glycosyltransferase family 2 protein [bacterium]|nr:glycosyltransferase family 2 protein [bacterium]